MWNCVATSDVWMIYSLAMAKWPKYMHDFSQLWGLGMEKLEEGDVELVAIIMHNLWLRRKEVVFNQ